MLRRSHDLSARSRIRLPSGAVRKPTRSREVGRGEKVLPGVWRLRLPLPWPGVPHCNAWALAAGPGIVLVDTGMHEPGSMAHLERALDQAGLKRRARAADRLHARPRRPLRPGAADRRARRLRGLDAPQPRPPHTRRRPRAGARAGVSRSRTRAASRRTPCSAGSSSAAARAAARPARCASTASCAEGDTVDTDLGTWRVVETPGHAPSHVCLYQPERRLLISGDHLLGRVSLYFDIGYTPDPVGEFLDSLDKVERLDARLVLSGHGRPFTDVAGPRGGQPRARASSASTPVQAALARGRAPPTRSPRRSTASASPTSPPTGC